MLVGLLINRSKINRVAVGIKQALCPPTCTNEKVGAAIANRPQTGVAGVATITDNDIAFGYRKALEHLTAFCLRQLEVGKPAARQVISRVQPPVRPRAARAGD